MPARLAFGVVGKGLSPISSSTTSFPRALSHLAIASTVKADSAVRFRANELSRGMELLPHPESALAGTKIQGRPPSLP